MYKAIQQSRTIMNITKFHPVFFNLVFGMFLCSGCLTNNQSNTQYVDREPIIEPDYSGVTIPHNIAPLNFCILDEAEFHNIQIITSSGQISFELKAKKGSVRFPQKKWRQLLSDNRGDLIKIEVCSTLKNGEKIKYKPISIHVTEESIDPVLCYRTLYPGYVSWAGMKIIQRSLEDFNESSIIENQLLDGNCVNCHTFRNQNPDEFLLHVRGSQKGTYFVNGDTITRRNLRTKNMLANAVHPA